MGLLSNLIKNAIGDGISKGISNAASKAAEKVVAPKAEAYANKVADSLDEATKVLEKRVEVQEDFMKEWEAKLPGFPVWCFGGNDLRLEEGGIESDGKPYYWFYAEDATEEGLQMYIALLKENGFVRKYSSSDEVLYKDLGGEYLVLGTTDAFGSAPTMSLTLVRTSDRSEIEV